jgi:glycosyltransferase involved in cell wall biosynthesis
VGQHELDYPRNVVNQRLMRAAGYSIELCHSRAPSFRRTLSILAQYWRVAPQVQIVFATEGSHRHLLWLKLAALCAGHKIIFDPFISLYNTEVEDRKLHSPLSPMAWLARWRDFCSCWCASCLVFDTYEHKTYFFDRYGLDKPYQIIPVGVDETTFWPRPAPRPSEDGRCDVLFYGTYIPLQGIDVIVAAAQLLQRQPAIRFTLVGNGQERPRIEALVKRLKLTNLTIAEPLHPARLAERIAEADVCLGIFDSAIKASQVVPNKVVQCAAMQKAIITRRSPAITRYFEDDESAVLVPPADPAALAAAIVRLAAAPDQRAALGLGARATFERHFSQAAQVPLMDELLSDMLGLSRAAEPACRERPTSSVPQRELDVPSARTRS